MLSIALLPAPRATTTALRPWETLMMVTAVCHNGWFSLFSCACTNAAPAATCASALRRVAVYPAGGRPIGVASRYYTSESTLREAVNRVAHAIISLDLERQFWTPGSWIQASGAAKAHFLGVQNVILAVDSFKVGIRVPDGTSIENRVLFLPSIDWAGYQGVNHC